MEADSEDMTMARWENRTGISALLDPDDSCLLFIDFGGTAPGLRSDPPMIGPAHYEVLTKAVDLSVPVFLSYMDSSAKKVFEGDSGEVAVLVEWLWAWRWLAVVG